MKGRRNTSDTGSEVVDFPGARRRDADDIRRARADRRDRDDAIGRRDTFPRMKGRLVATLLVLGVARGAEAGDAASAGPPPESAPAPADAGVEPGPPAPAAPIVVIPPPAAVAPPPPAPIVAPPAVVVAPLAPAPTHVPGGAAPLVAGTLTAFVPFVVGCALWSSNEIALEKTGTVFMAAGFAAAPWVSHGLEGRWKRAAIFGSISTATAAATLIAMEAKDPFVARYANRQRVAFGVFLTSAMFASAVGLFDSFLSAPVREAP
jgi:hypothetical protein